MITSDGHGSSIHGAAVTYRDLCPDCSLPQFMSTVIRLVRKDSHV
ncbi:hypothetical protein ABT112_33630 [Streptomyces sp. NPDC002055]